MKNIAKYSPWAMILDGMNDDLSRSLRKNSMLGEFITPEAEQWSPLVDIKEKKDCFVITADLPGVDNKDIEISLENNVLSIKGARNLERNVKEDQYFQVERISGTFYRQFTLPDHVETNKIEAINKNGVLEINIPKKARASPKKIAIKDHN
jgi:HSP20 family protein